ncbi:histidine kinase [Pannonibacter phragmitetus]|uniref:response regulator n=1 Tax=Pannonibacter phragmitetus TaxID=121719 RepID=UPI0006A011CD|nr:response regulator [Pannonibacter phragmitetus]KND18046.1 histidine kinase [Pannonibacter phragmitetus]MBA4205815.1 response regulator [Polymorphum sp.]
MGSSAEEPIRVLVADDSATVRKFIERALQYSGYDVAITAAADGKEAVELLSKNAFQIAFLDINMPQLNGVEVMAAIQVMGSKTFAVSMSDGLDEAAESKLKNFGAYDFLAKPFTAAQVKHILDVFQAISTPFDVLIVDDSTTVRKIVRKVLERSIFKLNIVEAGDGAAAIKLVSEKPYRVIFTDFNMPNMTGLELAERLSTVARGSDVILMSTEYNDTLDSAAEKVRARAFLRKPFYPADVDSILHHLFGLRHSRFSKQVRMFAMT